MNASSGDALAYPEAIFTTARVAEGRVLYRDLHVARLRHDVELLRIHPRPAIMSDQQGLWRALQTHEVEDRLLALSREMDAAAHAAREATLRVTARVVDGRLRTEIRTGPVRRPRWREGMAPLRVLLRPDPRPPQVPYVKDDNRVCFQALEAECLARQVDGVILEGPQGLREGTWFHLAMVRDGVWHLPPVAAGVILGTTRLALWEGLRARGIPCRETPLTREDLSPSAHLFALSSLLGIAPIAAVESTAFRVGPSPFSL